MSSFGRMLYTVRDHKGKLLYRGPDGMLASAVYYNHYGFRNMLRELFGLPRRENRITIEERRPYFVVD